MTDPESAFVAHLPLVDEVLRFIARRNHCGVEEAEEFASVARLKLIEDDYAVLRKFGGRSSLKTYLVTVLHRLFLDFRIQKWGKWRPSVAARKLGETAVRLETLVYRDGHSLDEAWEMLATNEGRAVTREEVAALLTRLPPRTARRTGGDEALEAAAVSADVVEGPTVAREAESRARGIRFALRAAIEELDPEDRLLLRMRYQDSVTVGAIGRALHLEEKPLYRRLERILERLRRELAAQGVTPADVHELVGADGAGWAAETFFDRGSAASHPGSTGKNPAPPQDSRSGTGIPREWPSKRKGGGSWNH